MKQLTRLMALVLCAVLMVSLFGCTVKPAEPTPPPADSVSPSTESPAADVYAQARAALESAGDVNLELLITTYTTIDGDEFSEQSAQTLTYKAMGTKDAVIVLEEEASFGVHSADYDPEAADPLRYKEIWSQGTVYAELNKTYRYCSPMDEQAAAARYTPVVLLSAELYGSITSETSDSGTTITFSDPTAGESWALPQEGELVKASGTALVNAQGTLEEMTYTVTYIHGPSEVTLEVQSRPLDTPKTVKAPVNPETYSPIGCVDALRMSIAVPATLLQTNSLTDSSLESMFCEAAGVLRNQSTVVNFHGRKEATKAKIETNVFFMDYSTMESEEYNLEETFLNGKLTTVVNDGLPSTDSIAWEDIQTYTAEMALSGMLDADYWKDVTATDLGSVYFLEYQLNDNFGNTMQNNISDMLWGDPSFLYNLASSYKNVEVNGYLSVDKYTGLPIAAGYYYEGSHTIDGYAYALTFQYDQSYEAPAKGAYKEITDQLPEEKEPETKPTPLFYHVTGENGQEMWLFGTIHVGDERTAYLPEEIYNAFAASDALAVECNSEAFEQQLEEDDELSGQVSDLYFFSDGVTTLETLMEEEEYARALKLLKAVGGYNMNMPYAKPYLWSNAIDMFYLRQGYQLHGDYGVEERLQAWADELGKEILEVESSLFQIKMLTGFSTELQLLMLEGSMEGTARDNWEGTMDLYEKWCAGDEAVLREELSDEVDLSELTEEELAEYEAQKPYMGEYNKAMSYDRNAAMLEKAIEYLESGDVIFYAVGLAHLLDSTNGLVDALRDAGYTVELVTYEN